MSDLDTLRQSYLSRISGAADPDALEQVRLAALGKKGEISGMMKELGRMTPEERQTTGAALNRLRDESTPRCAPASRGLRMRRWTPGSRTNGWT
jgi:phenylalanyl-tRNA synthetase alpha chain